MQILRPGPAFLFVLVCHCCLIPAIIAEADTICFYSIYSDVDTAEVYFDNDYVGDLSHGELTVRVINTDDPLYERVTLQKDGYNTTTADLPETESDPGYVSVFLAMGPMDKTDGSISIESTPPGAEIYIDEEGYGITPQTISGLAPGSYLIHLVKPQYEAWERTTVVTAGEISEVHANLEKIHKFGSLFLNSNPEGAKIFLDGWDYGTTPMTVGGITTGAHTVEITMEGFRDLTTTVNVIENIKTSMTYSLRSLSEPPEGPCSLYVTSSPTGAAIFIDSVGKGATPITITGLSTDIHQVKMTHTGYHDYTKSFVLPPGEIMEFNITMEPLPESEYAPTPLFPLIVSLVATGIFMSSRYRKKENYLRSAGPSRSGIYSTSNRKK